MKQFIGKILNLLGIIGHSLITIFSVVCFVIGCLIKTSIMGDFNEFLANPFATNYFIELIVFICGFLLTVLVIFYLLNCLIHNLVGKFTFVLSLLLLIYQVLMYGIFIYMKIYFEGLSTNGLNLTYIYWVGGFSLGFSALIFIGNLLNIRKAGQL